MKIGILIVSTRAFNGTYEDKSTQALMDICDEFFDETSYETAIVSDDFVQIKEQIITLCQTCNLVLTSGGTGVSSTDVTPEATLNVCDKVLPGFSEIMRLKSFEKAPTSIASRSVCGTRSKSLIINLPGSPKALRECLEPLTNAIVDVVYLLSGQKICLRHKKTHHVH